MTTEAVVMNQLAIAMAADSAVIDGNSENVFYSANKIFALSYQQPIGCMVFGSYDFMGIPWETIIKAFREQVVIDSLNILGDWAKAFINYLEKLISEITEENQLNWIKIPIDYYLNELTNKAQNISNIKYIEMMAAGNDVNFEILAKQTLLELEQLITEQVKKLDHNKNKNDPIYKAIIDSYEETISEKCISFCDKYGITSIKHKDLIHIVLHSLIYPNYESGIVIAGFGKEDFYPCMIQYSIIGVATNKLLYREIVNINVDDKTPSYVIGFAQDDMIKTFMEGMAPNLSEYMYQQLDIINQSIYDALQSIEVVTSTQLT